MYPVIQQQALSTPSRLLKWKKLYMAVDIGACFLWSTNTFKFCGMLQTEVKLQTYTGEEIQVVGSILLTAEAKGGWRQWPPIVITVGNGWLSTVSSEKRSSQSVCIWTTSLSQVYTTLLCFTASCRRITMAVGQWAAETQVQLMGFLKSPNQLIHFDESKSLIVACSVSPHSVCAVLSHLMVCSIESLITLASRSLMAAE